MTRCAPSVRARSSAQFRLDRTAFSNSASPAAAISRGATLISMLNWPISVWKAGSATSSSTRAFRFAGSPRSSTRLSSISMPVIGRSKSNCDSASIWASTSRQLRCLSRNRRRSSRVKTTRSTSRPIWSLLRRSLPDGHMLGEIAFGVQRYGAMRRRPRRGRALRAEAIGSAATPRTLRGRALAPPARPALTRSPAPPHRRPAARDSARGRCGGREAPRRRSRPPQRRRPGSAWSEPPRRRRRPRRAPAR